MTHRLSAVAPLLAAMALFAASCEDNVMPDVPVPVIPEEPAPEEVWIKDCPEGFALNTETHIYAACSNDVPDGYRASLRSSDESVIRVSPGVTGWDFYVTAASKGVATLTLSYNEAIAEYEVSSFEKVMPVLSVDKDYRMTFRLLPSDDEDAYALTGRVFMELDGKASVSAHLYDDRVYGHDHQGYIDYVTVPIHFDRGEISYKEPMPLADLSRLKDAMEYGAVCWVWDDALPRTGQPGYEDFIEYYSPDSFDLRYNIKDESGRDVPLRVDLSAIEGDGWKSVTRIERD